jgi:hypothetical protein
MALCHIWASIAAFFLTTLIAAAEVRLGPEVPLAELGRRPVDLDSALSAASDGDAFLLATIESDGHTHVRRVERDGTAGPAHDIGHSSHHAIAGSANGYLLVYGSYYESWARRVDASGAPVSAPHDIPNFIALATNGSSYLLVHYDRTGGKAGTILDLDGTPLRQLDIDFSGMREIGVHNGHYAFLVSTKDAVTLREIDDDGHVSDTPLRGTPPSYARAAFAPQGILVSWYDHGLWYSVLRYDGSALSPPSPVGASAGYSGLNAAWDGHEFLLAFNDGHAVRIAADGTLPDSPAFALFPQKIVDVIELAAAGSAVLAISAPPVYPTHYTHASYRVGRDFGTLSSTNDPGTVLTVPAEQVYGQIATSSRGLAAVWTDLSGYELRASINGRQISVERAELEEMVAYPTIAVGANTLLVAWWHASYRNSYAPLVTLLLRRYDFDGVPLDPKPVSLGYYLSGAALAAGFDGSAYRLVWENQPYAQEQLMTGRIGESGEPFGVGPLVSFHSSGPLGPLLFARLLWTGSDFLAAYHWEDYGAYDSIGLVRAAGGAEHSLFREQAILSKRFGAAVSKEQARVTYAWVSQTGRIAAGQTTFDGAPVGVLGFPLQLSNGGVRESEAQRLYGYANPDIARSGSEYVMTWTDIGPSYDDPKVMALRLDAKLDPIDPRPFEIAALPPQACWLVTSYSRDAIAPFVVATADGAIIAYPRFDDGVPRIVTRTVDRLGTASPNIPRRRVAH